MAEKTHAANWLSSWTLNIDFASLTLRDALDLALLVEEEARDRYLGLAEVLTAQDTPDTAAFFGKMAQAEAAHWNSLKQRRTSLFFDAPAQLTRTMLFGVEAPDFEQVRAYMSPRQALEVVLEAEEKAHAFYASAARAAKVPEAQKLLAELAREESEHRRMVQAELARLPAALNLGPQSSWP